MRRLLALRDLVHDAVEKITDLVEETHESVARKPVAMLGMIEPLGSAARAVDSVRRVTARSVFDSVRATNRGVQALSDLGVALTVKTLEQARQLGAELPGEKLATELASTPALAAWTERAESALNAVMGDFLAARENGLAIQTSLRAHEQTLILTPSALAAALPHATGKLCIFVHGLGCSDSIWRERDAVTGTPTSFGERLEPLGYTPLALRYNSGLHISENGRALSTLLSELVAAYPCPVDEITLVGHSMGGLVARSAAHYGKALEQSWADKLTRLLCIGSPHFGAPLERAGNVVASVLRFFDTAGTQVPAKLINARSAGVKDLRFGYLLDEDWAGGDPDAFLDDRSHHAPFISGVTYGYIAARFRPLADGKLGELLGDLLVQVPSASGSHDNATRHLPFHMGHVLEGVHHIGLTTHPAVFEQLQRFLTEPASQALARDVLSAD